MGALFHQYSKLGFICVLWVVATFFVFFERQKMVNFRDSAISTTAVVTANTKGGGMEFQYLVDGIAYFGRSNFDEVIRIDDEIYVWYLPKTPTHSSTTVTDPIGIVTCLILSTVVTFIFLGIATMVRWIVRGTVKQPSTLG